MKFPSRVEQGLLLAITDDITTRELANKLNKKDRNYIWKILVRIESKGLIRYLGVGHPDNSVIKEGSSNIIRLTPLGKEVINLMRKYEPE